MHPLGDLTRSFAGWRGIIAGKPTARDEFHTDRAGFVTAAVTLALAGLCPYLAGHAPPPPLRGAHDGLDGVVNLFK